MRNWDSLYLLRIALCSRSPWKKQR